MSRDFSSWSASIEPGQGPHHRSRAVLGDHARGTHGYPSPPVCRRLLSGPETVPIINGTRTNESYSKVSICVQAQRRRAVSKQRALNSFDPCVFWARAGLQPRTIPSMPANTNPANHRVGFWRPEQLRCDPCIGPQRRSGAAPTGDDPAPEIQFEWGYRPKAWHVAQRNPDGAPA